MDTKPWYKSKGIMGSLIAVLAVLAGFFGIDIGGAEQAELVDLVTAIVGTGGAALAFIGRIRANTKISSAS